MRMGRCVRLVALAAAGALVPAGADERKPQLQLAGFAEVVDGRVRLTPAWRQTVGAAWFTEKRYLAAGFEAVFRFQITGCGGLGQGADGLAFVLQNEGPHAIAGRGSSGGFALGDGWGDTSKPGIPAA